MKNKKGKDKFNFVSNGNNKKPSGNNGNYYKNNKHKNNHNNGKAYYSNKGNNNNKNKNNNVNKNSNNNNNSVNINNNKNNNNNNNNINNINVSTNNNFNNNNNTNNYMNNNHNNSYSDQFVKKEIIEEEIEQLELDDEEDLVEEIKNNASEEVSNNLNNDFFEGDSSIISDDNRYNNQSSQNNVFEKDEDVFFENTAGLNINADNAQNDFKDWFDNNIENNNEEITNNSNSYENNLKESLDRFENSYSSENNNNNSNDYNVNNNDNDIVEDIMNTIRNEVNNSNNENNMTNITNNDNTINNDSNDFNNNIDESLPFDREDRHDEFKDNYNNFTSSRNYYEDNGIANDIYGEVVQEDKKVEEEIEEYNVDTPTPVVHEEVEVPVSNIDNSINRKNKVHFNFQMRVAILLSCIVILLGSAAFLILKSITTQDEMKVGYEETTKVDYSACLSTNDPYKTKCLDSNQKYSSNTIKNIKATFTYSVDFDEKVDYNLAYHVVLVNRIYDRFDSKNIIYENEDVIVDKTIEDINDDNAKFDIDVDIDYKTYNDFVINYIKKYSSNSEASLDALLYITDGEDTRKVATINIPLNKSEFKITNTLVSKERHIATIVLNDWTDKDTRSIIIGIAFVLIAIVLIIRFTKLIMSTITKKSAYEVKLHEILNEYDRMIVVARDGYESDTVMKVVKVSSFEELLDARNILNKPIIYSKINNVKSEFIVEDENKIYKYVMKEADIH